MTMRVAQRGIAVLAIAGVAIGAVAIAPATSATKFLTKKKAMKLFYTKAAAETRFLDEAEGDAAFLNMDEKAADAELIDGLDSPALARKLDNVVTVSQSGGDFTSVQAAIDSITDESPSNRYLVVIGPGTYSGRIVMTPNVSLLGSGIGVTTLSAGPASSCIDGYTLKGANATTVRDLTIGNSGAGACGVGILNAGFSFAFYRNLLISTSVATDTMAILNDNAEPILIGVEMEIGQGSGSGDAIGVRQQNDSFLTMRGSSIIGCTSGDDVYGIHNDDSSAQIVHSTISAFICGGGTGEAVGIRNTNGSGDFVDVNLSDIHGSTASIATDVGYTTRVGGSRLAGGTVSGIVTCGQVYDEAYAPFDNMCP